MDMSQFIVAKSDQLNADDLMGGPITVTIERVTGSDSADQPVSVHYVGCNGKPYKPCKSMRRVMVNVWGMDAAKYAGKSMTLRRDPDVQFGGMKLGGIRISHMSGIDTERSLALNVTRGKKALYKVLPLKAAPQQAATAEPETDVFGLAPIPAAPSKAEQWTEQYVSSIADCATIEDLMALQASSAKALAKLQTDKPDLHEQAVEAGSKRAQQLQEVTA